MNEEMALLAEYLRTRSEAAFSRLVERYLPLVYSVARRQLRDAAEADDASQQVFTLLAQKANNISPVHLSGWLHRTTRNVCANIRRKQQRRLLHERKAAQMKPEARPPADAAASAWQQLAPLLDDAIDALPEEERIIVIERFFQKRNFAEMGAQRQISQDAARKRVERATDKLRAFFARAGVTTVPALTLESLLLTNAMTDAPPMLAKSIATCALAAKGGTGATIWGVNMAISSNKLLAGLAAVLLIGVGAVVVAPALRGSSPKQSKPLQPMIPQTFMPTPLKTTTANGVVVELLGISNATEGPQWWDPSGKPIAGFSGPDFDFAKEGFKLAVRVGLTGGNRFTDSVLLQPLFDPAASSFSWPETQEPKAVLIQATWQNPLPATCKLTLGVAGGPWRTMAESSTPGIETTHSLTSGKPGTRVIFRPIGPGEPGDGERVNPAWKTTARMTIVFPMSSSVYEQPQIRLVAIARGKEIQGAYMTHEVVGDGTTVVRTYVFGAHENEITAIRWKVRPYEWVVFENVALRRGEKTYPAVKLLPAGAQHQ